ncbi:MAG: hypothetical protein IJA82_03450 [Clostridia bacterium]|nr:hypothetical protein [Clostridia bacterium]
MSIKIKDLAIGKGITREPNDEARLLECINLIPENGALRKRGGFFSPLIFQNENNKPKRINGLFGFGEKILVHAGTDLYACPRDLSYFERLEVTLTDNKTSGLVADSMLYIVGGGDLYVYTGKEIFPIKKLPSIYAPTTRINVFDQYGKNKYENYESPSLLTPRRVNLLMGTTSFRTNEVKPTFLLDGNILKGSSLEIEVRIRLSITGLPDEAYKSTLKGVDSEGLETPEIVTIKYRAESVNSEIAIFPSEPIYDDLGRLINIRGQDGEPLEYDKIPLGVSIKGDRITFSYDIPTFEEGVANIKVTYEVENSVDIKNATTCSLCPREMGGYAIAFSLGDNRLYYSDQHKGGDYIPTSNVVCVGTGGEKITSLLEMSNGALGVFTNIGFYKVTLYTEDGGYQVLNSADKIGSTSSLVNTTIAGDTLTFNGQGVFGTHTSSPYMDQIGYFYQRGSKISTILKEIEDKEEAVAVNHKGKYFLFLGDKTLVADTSQRFTREGAPTGAYEYEWYQWADLDARYAISYGGTLYLGKENGRVGFLTEDLYDKIQDQYSSEKMTLFLTPQKDHTAITIDTGSKKSKGNRGILSSHERRISNKVTYENGKYLIPKEDFYTHDGGIGIYEGQEIALYDYGDRVIFKGKAGKVDPYLRTIELDAVPFEGAVFPLFLYFVRDTYEYDFKEVGLHYGLFENGTCVWVRSQDPVLTVIERQPIVSYLKTSPISLGGDLTAQNLIGAYLRVTEDTKGGVLYGWESDKHKGYASLTLSKQMHLDRLDLSRLCLYDSFKRDYYVPTLERNVKYVSLTLKSTTPDPFGITGLGIKLFEYEE